VPVISKTSPAVRCTSNIVATRPAAKPASHGNTPGCPRTSRKAPARSCGFRMRTSFPVSRSTTTSGRPPNTPAMVGTAARSGSHTTPQFSEMERGPPRRNPAHARMSPLARSRLSRFGRLQLQGARLKATLIRVRTGMVPPIRTPITSGRCRTTKPSASITSSWAFGPIRSPDTTWVDK